jgi:hypothetical protein
MDTQVRLRCVTENRKLRVKIVSPGYNQQANCQFPTAIRAEGREFLVPASDIAMVEARNKFFYRVKKDHIAIVDPLTPASVIITGLKVYGEEELSECCICYSDSPATVFVILAPCGHYCLCQNCANTLRVRGDRCPLCRSQISQVVTKEQLQ